MIMEYKFIVVKRIIALNIKNKCTRRSDGKIRRMSFLRKKARKILMNIKSILFNDF